MLWRDTKHEVKKFCLANPIESLNPALRKVTKDKGVVKAKTEEQYKINWRYYLKTDILNIYRVIKV